MKKIKKISICFLIFFFMLVGGVKADLLDDDVEVEENSLLTYYLDVTYDGVDVKGVDSKESTSAQIYSDCIQIEDKIPEGLTFIGFVPSSDGKFGAVKQSDKISYATGWVIDDTNEASTTEGTWNADKTEYTYHGLHYTVSDRTVRFRIKDLQAGGLITIGIITKTPTIDDPETLVVEKRRDFYNQASGLEGIIRKISNMVHAFMQNGDEPVYDVEYVIEGEKPADVGELPSTQKYAENTKVGVANPIQTEEYSFNGWSSDDVTISSSKDFVMPNKKVVLKGSFSKSTAPKYKVTYQIDGDKPSGYEVPTEKAYVSGALVKVDCLAEGDIIGQYKFLGWNTSDVTISNEKDFFVENKDVVITGKFEQIKYKVEYKFFDTLIPPEGDSLLPETKYYPAGTKVKLEKNPVSNGFEFSGWYQNDVFEMPEKDIVIYGEWIQVFGYFEPKIEKEIINKKTSYKPGDVVEFKITVTNQNDFEIDEILVRENNIKSEFKESDNYKKESATLATIKSLNANEKAVLYATYTVDEKDSGTIKNEVEIVCAIGANKYTMVEKDYKASCEFKIWKPGDPEPVIDPTPNTDPMPNADPDLDPKNETIVEKIKDKLNPKTGDTIYYYVAILVITLIIFTKIKKSKNKSKRKTHSFKKF